MAWVSTCMEVSFIFIDVEVKKKYSQCEMRNGETFPLGMKELYAAGEANLT